MATVENLRNFFQEQANILQANRENVKRIVLNQRQREIEIISRDDSLCPLRQLEQFDLRAEDIDRAFKDGYGDANVLKALMCMNNALVVYPSTADLRDNYKIRHYIKKLRQIGAESVTGFAMASTIREKGERNPGMPDEPFVVKSPRVISAESDLDQIHEYFVGAYGTNNLRNRIPNFAYIMGMFKCSPPFINQNREVLTFCQNSDPQKQVTYILYENIKRSVTFSEFITGGCTFEQYLNILLQVIFALDLAYVEFRGTHNDLHDRNVLVEELDEEIFIPYRVSSSGTIMYLRTRYLARIIDFGRSFIVYNNEPFGFALLEGGVYPDRSYPIYDIYKLLMTSLRSASLGKNSADMFTGKLDSEVPLANPDVFNNAKEFMEFFSPGISRGPDGRMTGALDYVVKTQELYYSLFYLEEFNIRPLEFFEIMILPLITPPFLTPDRAELGPENIYGCANKGICLTLQSAISLYAEPDSELLDDPYVFYEMYFEALDSRSQVEGLIEEGAARVPSYMGKLRASTLQDFQEYNQIVSNLSIHSLVAPGRESVTFQDLYLTEYRNFVDQVVRAIDLKTSIHGSTTIMNFLLELYSYLVTDRTPIETYQTESSILREAVASIQRDIDYLRQLDPNLILRINPRIDWLYNKLGSFMYVISL